MLIMMAFSQMGYYFLLNHAQQEQKEFIQELLHKTLPEDELTIIDFTGNKEKIYWEEEGKEFFFEGKMYDLVKMKNDNGQIIFYCINDKQEEELINNNSTIIKNNSFQNKKTKNNIETAFCPFLVTKPLDLSANKSPAKKFWLSISSILAQNADCALKPPQA